jgi:hypothetical protein
MLTAEAAGSAQETDEGSRQTLMPLNAEEEAKLASIESHRDRKRAQLT